MPVALSTFTGMSTAEPASAFMFGMETCAANALVDNISRVAKSIKSVVAVFILPPYFVLKSFLNLKNTA
jgi:hypothetical protein